MTTLKKISKVTGLPPHLLPKRKKKKRVYSIGSINALLLKKKKKCAFHMPMWRCLRTRSFKRLG